MLPIVDKPTLQYIIEECVASGIEEILIITGRNKKSIEDHFDRSVELEMELEKAGKQEMLEMVREISDMVNINANIQNRNLLLQCVPSNNYRYPTSGVGLIKYLHANLSHSGLAEKLQTEFKDDKVEIINAAFNSYSGDLELDLDFSEADAGV